MKNFESVIAALTIAVEASPDDAELRLHLARVLIDANEPETALDHLEAVLRATPADAEALNTAAQAANLAQLDERAAGYRQLAAALASTREGDLEGNEPPREPIRLFAVGGETPIGATDAHRGSGRDLCRRR